MRLPVKDYTTNEEYLLNLLVFMLCEFFEAFRKFKSDVEEEFIIKKLLPQGTVYINTESA